ncbi:MAG: hypothetical protein SFV54_06180 [Bryobacteraceae bacterium]|nr:hypothetical protein [Bryobacteraceae bacterium]
MKLRFFCVLIPFVATGADSAGDLNEKLRQTFAKITAYGEKARVCAGVIASDQAQLRDAQAKIRDAQDRTASLAREGQKLNATVPRPASYKFDYEQLRSQIANNSVLITKLTEQVSFLTNDIALQQKCLDLAHAGLNGILADPAKPLQDATKK